jgi:hypothetical protein
MVRHAMRAQPQLPPPPPAHNKSDACASRPGGPGTGRPPALGAGRPAGGAPCTQRVAVPGRTLPPIAVPPACSVGSCC